MSLRYALPLFAFALVARPAAAQTGTCVNGRAYRDLDGSDLRARVLTVGSLFGIHFYEVPRFSSHAATAVAGIWLAGEVGGTFRVADGTFYGGTDFWPGPLDAGPTLPDPADCSPYDRIWSVTTADVARYESTGVASEDLAAWPVGLGAAAVDAGGTPIVTTDRARTINLTAGERPVLYGSQTAFWVMNDLGNTHVRSSSLPLGVEVRATAFVVYAEGDSVLSRASFYRYEVVNRNTVAIENARFSLPQITALGGQDDYVGTDSARGLAYVYNGDDADEDYGLYPPAVGVDLLGGFGTTIAYPNNASMYPVLPIHYARYMNAQWIDGTPLTEGGEGHGGGTPIPYLYPGDPVAPAYWSMRCEDPACTSAAIPGYAYLITTSPAFRLEPGASHTIDVALLYARGATNIGSVTALRAASDRVQALHDSGALYGPALASASTPLAAPAPLAPEEGTVYPIGVGEVTLAWAAVPGAVAYEVQIDTTGAPFQGRQGTRLTSSNTLAYALPSHAARTYHWRVRALALGANSAPGPARTFSALGYPQPGISAAAVVEVARPGGADPCAGAPADPGCQQGLGGNTVFHDGDTGADYYVTGSVYGGEILSLMRFVHMASPDYYEVRFTPTGGYGVYGYATGAGINRIVRVPFELWNVRTTLTNASDDVRMIPFLGTAVGGAAPPLDWADHFSGNDPWAGRPRPTVPITDPVYGFMPDRGDGYARFEQAALAFGGAGATYDPTADGDTQVDGDPYHGGACTNQGYYADFCYRNTEPESGAPFPNTAGAQRVFPIGRFAFADLAADGTTPGAGTTIRLRTALLGTPTDAAPPAPAVAAALAVERVAPNPARGRAVVAYAVPVAGRAVVAVYDALGRRVAVLADGPVAAGRHEAELNTAGLSPGVYVVVVESGGARAARTLAVVR